MPYTTVNKSTDHFNTKLFTGNGSTQSITGVGFQPDFTWIKDRDQARENKLTDAVRGVTKAIVTNSAAAETTDTYGLTAFGTDGFTVGSTSGYNNNSENFASWNWKAGTTSGLSGGTITPSSYSINATSGFGIYKYTGNGTSGATIAHGLGKEPKMIIIKRTDAAPNWQIYHWRMGNTKFIEFTSGGQQTGTSRWNDTTPTTSVFTLGNDNDVNGSGNTYIAYVFCDVQGYQKCGGYIGNGASGVPNAEGAFVNLGFKPKFIMVKSYSNSGAWTIWDNKRAGFNPQTYRLRPEVNHVEYTGNAVWIDLCSNGFKLRQGDTDTNGDGYYYMYLAIGQSLVGSNNVPCTAR